MVPLNITGNISDYPSFMWDIEQQFEHNTMIAATKVRSSRTQSNKNNKTNESNSKFSLIRIAFTRVLYHICLEEKREIPEDVVRFIS